MDVVSQTSFIPKKPIIQTPETQVSRGTNLLLLVSVFLFVGAMVLTLGVFLYKSAITSDIANKKVSLARARDAFEPASILKLQRLARRLDLSRIVLANHLAPSQLFDVLESSTLQNVRFTSMDLVINQAKNTGLLTMRGQARSYGAVARQSDVFAKAAGIKNPVFSELNLDQRGNVVFTFTATIDPNALHYQTLLNSRVPEASPSTASSSPNI